MNLLLTFSCYLSFLHLISAAKILCIFPTISRSHYYIGHSLVKGLAARGHYVTYLTQFEEKEKVQNVRSEVLKDSKPDVITEMNFFEMIGQTPFSILFSSVKMALENTEQVLSDPVIQAALNGNDTYDLVITEWVQTDALQGIAYRLKVPSVLITSFVPSILTNYITANPDISSFMPHVFGNCDQRMNFWERTQNFLLTVVQGLHHKFYYLPEHDKLLHKYVPEAPNIYELNANTAVQIFNSDPVINGPFPLMPNTVEVGGIHVEFPKQLPKDLQKYLDESNDGVIYFTLGGNLKSKHLPLAMREALLRVFSKLKQRILWKFEENLPEKPGNVEIRKWLPQQDILAHPNIKLFITHGGLLGTTESLHRGVPVLGIPVFFDQLMNMRNAERLGVGISVPYKEFTEEKLFNAINRILTDSSYSQTSKKLSVLLKDQQVTPVEKAVFWIEYVLRNGGAPHLKSVAHDLTWYQYYSLDVILFLAIVVVVLVKIIRVVIRMIFCRKMKQKEKVN
ncbi:UDP-glucosyltransferase [Holotrichia oblita]|uniref:UDP-glucosyltransferase n=1 Tax=Holotrichia oblita TaxID=644536 RepID=A0ACB9T9A8_HOLOL|nr:UDP-glucosyltransferase [Holotrichia oblita]